MVDSVPFQFFCFLTKNVVYGISDRPNIHSHIMVPISDISDANGWRRINYTIRISNISPLFFDEKSKFFYQNEAL